MRSARMHERKNARTSRAFTGGWLTSSESVGTVGLIGLTSLPPSGVAQRMPRLIRSDARFATLGGGVFESPEYSDHPLSHGPSASNSRTMVHKYLSAATSRKIRNRSVWQINTFCRRKYLGLLIGG